MKFVERDNGYYLTFDDEGNPEIGRDERPDKPGKSPYDKVFFDTINRFNKEHKQGESLIIQVSETEAMLIYWAKYQWHRVIYPFRKEVVIT